MKKLSKILSIFSLGAIFLVGKSEVQAKNREQDNKKITIISTSFPIYDWTKEVLGENIDKVELVLLNKSGVDTHSFQPSTADIIKISKANLVIYNGGISEEWLEKIAKEDKKKNKYLSLMEVAEEKDQLMEEANEYSNHNYSNDSHHTHEHDHKHHDHHHHGGHSHHHDDEHIWLSLKNAEIYVEAIGEVLEEIDPNKKDEYNQNTENYIDKLEDLDEKYEDTLKSKKEKVMVIGDRFPFIYLCRDYDITAFAAFTGCSSESEASFETIVNLAKKVDRFNLKYIFDIEGNTHRIAKTIKENTNSKDQKILTLNSLQSIKETDIKNKVTYLKVMEDNLKILNKGLN